MRIEGRLRDLLAEATREVPLDWRRHGDCLWGSDPARVGKDVPSDALVECGTDERAELVLLAVTSLPKLLAVVAASRPVSACLEGLRDGEAGEIDRLTAALAALDAEP